MISVLILTHGDLGVELLRAAREIAGALESFETLCLGWDDGLEVARERIADRLPRLDRGEGVLILTDVYGSTPSNAAASFYRPGRVEIVSGVNLPMVVRLGCVLRHDSPPLRSLARMTVEKGRASIRRSRGKIGANAQRDASDCEQER